MNEEIKKFESLEIPSISKMLFWICATVVLLLLGLLSFEIFLIPIETIFRYLIFIIWLMPWVLLIFVIYNFLCLKRTKVMEEGLIIKSVFLRRNRFIKYEMIKNFNIFKREGGSSLTFIWISHPNKRLRIRLGKRNHEIVEAFFEKKFKSKTKAGRIEYCKYHTDKRASFLCQKCGVGICQTCMESKTYNYSIGYSHYSDSELKCVKCMYIAFYKISIFCLIFGILLGLLCIFLPYKGTFLLGLLWCATLSPFFFGISLGTSIANRLRLLNFEDNVKKSLNAYIQSNKFEISLSLFFSILTGVKLLFTQGTFTYGTSTFYFQFAFPLFLIFHQFMFWACVIKFKP